MHVRLLFMKWLESIQNDLLGDIFEVDDNKLPEPKKKPGSRGDTDWKTYKYGWNWNGIDHSRAEGCRLDSEKLDDMNK